MNLVTLSLFFPFIIISLISRLVLTSFSLFNNEITFDITLLISVFLLGYINDFLTYIYTTFPLIVIFFPFSLLLNKLYIYRYVVLFFHFIWINILFLLVFAEYLFWEEFSDRFNFIAVDYLVYTREVTKNILESYPIPLLLSIIVVISSIFFLFYYKKFLSLMTFNLPLKNKIKQLGFFTILFFLLFLFFNPNYLDIKNDRYLNELSKNGIYNLFSAFRNNSLDYQKYYQSIDLDKAFSILKDELLQNNQTYVDPKKNSITRYVNYNGLPKNHNVVLIMVESLSNEFIGMQYKNESLTPNLDQIKKLSINFSNFYATGTRTVRGLEAVTLAVPPLPGSAIVRRPNNNNLFSISTILKKLNYDMQFLYGGYGQFDNMNEFFSGNGFRIIDRNKISDNEVTFSNAWGVGDEDLFKKAIIESDKNFAENKPFFQFIMTTSNHRPFTYPDNKIDIPSGEGRMGGVKYADYAIGKFFEEATQKPWFKNTIFIVTADHCASSSGRTEIPIHKYHIPLMIYAPHIFLGKKISTFASQIDLAPTILGMLNISYISNFFGNDIFHKKNDNLVMGTYQLLGFYQKNKFAVLGPQKKTDLFTTQNLQDSIRMNNIDDTFLFKAISYYQISDYLFKNNLMKENEENSK